MVKFCQRITRQYRQVSLDECLAVAQEVASVYPSKSLKAQKAEIYRRISKGLGQPATHHHMYDKPYYGKRRNS